MQVFGIAALPLDGAGPEDHGNTRDRRGGSTSAPAIPARSLAFTIEPAGTTAGAAFDVTVVVTDAHGPVAEAPVALALGAGPAGATLAGTATRSTTAAGVAAFTGLSIARAGAGYVLTATSGAGRADSARFDVAAGAPDAAASALTGPAGAVDADGVATALVVATVRDALGNPVPGTAVTFSAPGAALSAPAATADVAGQAWVTACTTTAGAVTVTASFAGASRHVDVRFVVRAPLWVTGYWVGYQRDLYPPEQVDLSAMTHVAVGAVLPNADGTVDATFFLGATAGPAAARVLATRAHAAGRRALLMVGGDGFGARFRSAASAANRAAFVANLVRVAEDLGYDGFDLDWEPLEQADLPALLALAAALRAAVPGVTLTIPVGWLSSNGGGAAAWLGQLAPAFDQINIMSYGMADNWGGWVSWHSAALAGQGGDHPTSVSYSATAYAAPPANVPRGKLGIGLGFYGSCWRGPTAPLQPLAAGQRVVASDNDMPYRAITADYFAPAAYHWDAAASMGYLSFAAPTGPAGCTFVSYEDAASIAAKGAWVRDQGFGGAIIWTVNQGALSPTGPNPPLEAVKAAFLR